LTAARLRRIQVARGEAVTAAGTAEELLKKLRQNIRETIEQNAELALPEAFVGCVVLRFETEDGEPTTIEFLVPRGCGGKIVEREIKKVPQPEYRPTLGPPESLSRSPNGSIAVNLSAGKRSEKGE